MDSPIRYEIGVDIGGTFTDVVCRGTDGTVRLVKIPTTRPNPADGIRQAVDHMQAAWGVAPGAIARFVHGTTMATNAVLERKGARLGLLATEGFSDVLEIGRQSRRDMYDLRLRPQTPAFLAPGARRAGVRERIAPDGSVVAPLDEASLAAALDALVGAGVDSIAVAFLFSFANPAHEIAARDFIRRRHPALAVSISSEVDPAFREYERTCVTAFDAYLKPVVDDYLATMERDLAAKGVTCPLQIMQSRGGIASSTLARLRPVRLFLSGPAAGVIGGAAAGLSAGTPDIITIDIGGTSSDIALIAGGTPLVAPDGVIDGFSVRVPMVDVNAIGAGGGSIAWIDGAGSLKVGPESAGSAPGPACYGRGGERPTVTDASVVLGYINPDYFAGGTLKLEPRLAHAAIERAIAAPLGLSVEQAALGIHRVVNANMAEGMRLVSVGRGVDPRRYALLPLGGGGPLHATALARELGMSRVVVPPHPGVLSAAGLLAAPVEHEAAAAFGQPLDGLTREDLARIAAPLDAACERAMLAEGIAPGRATRLHFADVCFEGQSYHLEIPVDLAGPDPVAALRRDFLAAHDRIYGYSGDGPARTVNLRAIHRAGVALAGAGAAAVPVRDEARKGTRRILVESGWADAAVLDRAAFAAGTTFDGPAIVEQADTTTLVEPGWSGRTDAAGNLVLERNAP